jgi:hypothetical protein
MKWFFRKDEELSPKEKAQIKHQTSKADAQYQNDLATKLDEQAKLDKFYSGGSNSKYNPFAKEPINKSQFIPSKRIPGTVTRFPDTKLDWDFKD